jgi:signal transduction histidine kinase
MVPEVIRILLVEDNPDDAQLVRRKLERELARPDWFRLNHVGAMQPALDALGKGEHDVVLLDLQLPDSEGISTVTRVREAVTSVPIVVFTGAGDEEMALAALRAGAQDYLVKDELGGGAVLHRSIRYAIERMRITEERRQLQERLHQAEKLQSLGVFAAGAAFGFNTLLGTVLEHADHGLESPANAGHVTECLRSIRRTTLRAAQMASQLRDYALEDSGETSPLDLSSFVLDVSPSLEVLAGPNLSIVHVLASKLPRIEGNAFELRQLMVNLVLNASEAMGDAPGTISIETEVCKVGRELLVEAQGAPGLHAGRYVVLRVKDSGHGLDARTRGRLFDPFYTTKFAGRGLGLAAAVGIARRHGGAIHVGERSGGGAEFAVLFPALR